MQTVADVLNLLANIAMAYSTMQTQIALHAWPISRVNAYTVQTGR